MRNGFREVIAKPGATSDFRQPGTGERKSRHLSLGIRDARMAKDIDRGTTHPTSITADRRLFEQWVGECRQVIRLKRDSPPLNENEPALLKQAQVEVTEILREYGRSRPWRADLDPERLIGGFPSCGEHLTS
jgi:hypothetical protein